ncbi:hypothetical protein [Roseivivax isoporae]|uniref:Lipoprotein n=1 Tax=Roseivivax isoporae LMG 25204 TaxID=1449351 RepID=X7FBM4_9RHOB|nr:hypothetical protein [Roseivivax isoporae]ETX29479.1 hypothetical protein RISW2_23370 [Roseivivax isoporae LMG 25204]
MRAILILCAAALALAACTESSKRVRFDGNFYRGSAKAPATDRHNFTASVGPVRLGLNGARQAAFYEGTLHCVRHFGTSDIAWAVHPTEAPQEALPIQGDRLVVRGRCLEWPEPGA